MRNGIMELVERAPSNVNVLVVAAAGMPSLGSLSRFISGLNHPDEWIDFESGDHVQTSKLKSRHGLLLLMSSTKGSIVVNMKREAKLMNITCPQHALTIGEVKDILTHLHSKRTTVQKKREVVPAGSNGASLNGSTHHEIAEESPVEVTPPRVEVLPVQTPVPSIPVDLMSTLKQMQDLVANEQLLNEDNARLRQDIEALQIRHGETERLLNLAKEEVANKDAQLSEAEQKLEAQKSKMSSLTTQLDNMRKVLGTIEGLVASSKRI